MKPQDDRAAVRTQHRAQAYVKHAVIQFAQSSFGGLTDETFESQGCCEKAVTCTGRLVYMKHVNKSRCPLTGLGLSLSRSCWQPSGKPCTFGLSRLNYMRHVDIVFWKKLSLAAAFASGFSATQGKQKHILQRDQMMWAC